MNSRISNTTDRRRPATVLLPMLFLVGAHMNAGVESFQPAPSFVSPLSSSSSSSSPATIRGRNSILGAVPLGDMDPQEVAAHAQALNGFLEHQTSLLVSAAAATADAVPSLENLEATEAAIASNDGWWAAYLNIFKTTIEFVHSGIDGPIHKLGWEGGTWGFSIALFTAGKYERNRFTSDRGSFHAQR